MKEFSLLRKEQVDSLELQMNLSYDAFARAIETRVASDIILNEKLFSALEESLITASRRENFINLPRFADPPLMKTLDKYILYFALGNDPAKILKNTFLPPTPNNQLLSRVDSSDNFYDSIKAYLKGSPVDYFPETYYSIAFKCQGLANQGKFYEILDLLKFVKEEYQLPSTESEDK